LDRCLLFKLAVVNFELGDVAEAASINHSLVEALANDRLLTVAH
jgi:hypothetical protein